MASIACYHPLEAFQIPGEPIHWKEVANSRPIKLPCGHCIGCKLVRVRSWAIRCVHESQMHEVNSFVTLTYEGEPHPSLVYSDFRHFLRRVRYKCGPTRFFMCGEYGALNLRPHFHALLFGRTFPHAVKCGQDIYSSRLLSALWPHGFSSFGSVTYQSAAYVASYSVKSGTVSTTADFAVCDPDTGELVSLRRPFIQMSRRPGIGYTWFEKYWQEVYVPRDAVVLAGARQVPPPRYYDKLLESTCPDLRDYKSFQRYAQSAQFLEDTTPERLRVREICAQARQSLKRQQL